MAQREYKDILDGVLIVHLYNLGGSLIFAQSKLVTIFLFLVATAQLGSQLLSKLTYSFQIKFFSHDFLKTKNRNR